MVAERGILPPSPKPHFPTSMLDVAPITRRQGQAGKLVRPSPAKRDVLVTRRLSHDAHPREDNQERRVGIGDHELLVAHLRDFDAQLLVQLATRRVRVRLPRLALAAGKLPEPAVSFVVRPLTDEELVSARDNGGNYADRCQSERSPEGAEARNRRRPDRGPSTGRIAIPRCARNDIKTALAAR
jgi:hypothetical protein